MSKMLTICSALLFPALAPAQEGAHKPKAPVDQWVRKTILLIGAPADDDAMSHGTLAMLQAQVYVVTLTTGNVGTQDPSLSRLNLPRSAGKRN